MKLPLYELRNMCGWGNGYVAVDEEHPWYGVYYDNIDVEIHGGLTFSQLIEEDIDIGSQWYEYRGKYVVGFDTAHLYDTLDRWPKEAVEEETKRLWMQALKALQLKT